MLATIREYLDINKRFAPDAFLNSINVELPLTLPNGTKATCFLRKVEILDDGKCVELTFEFQEEFREFLMGKFQSQRLTEVIDNP